MKTPKVFGADDRIHFHFLEERPNSSTSCFKKEKILLLFSSTPPGLHLPILHFSSGVEEEVRGTSTLDDVLVDDYGALVLQLVPLLLLLLDPVPTEPPYSLLPRWEKGGATPQTSRVEHSEK